MPGRYERRHGSPSPKLLFALAAFALVACVDSVADDEVEPGTGTPHRVRGAPHPEMVEVRTSLIPGAGLGLFAKVDIPEGTYLGPYAGEHLTHAQVDALGDTKASEYLFAVPECANEPEFDWILGDVAHYVSRVNYAPKRINGRDTGLQSADFDVMCKEPHARLYTTRAVAAGEEIYADYGEGYDFFFMAFPAVQAHFLKVTGIPAQKTFSWDYDDAE